jgi:hypothetical protein
MFDIHEKAQKSLTTLTTVLRTIKICRAPNVTRGKMNPSFKLSSSPSPAQPGNPSWAAACACPIHPERRPLWSRTRPSRITIIISIIIIVIIIATNIVLIHSHTRWKDQGRYWCSRILYLDFVRFGRYRHPYTVPLKNHAQTQTKDLEHALGVGYCQISYTTTDYRLATRAGRWLLL